MCKDSHEQKFIAIAIGSRPIHIALEGLWPHNMILEVCWDSLWTLSFGLSRFHSHGSWLVCEVALIWVVSLKREISIKIMMESGHIVFNAVLVEKLITSLFAGLASRAHMIPSSSTSCTQCCSQSALTPKGRGRCFHSPVLNIGKYQHTHFCYNLLGLNTWTDEILCE